MRKCDIDQGIVILDDIREAGILNPGWLRRRFNPLTPKAAFHTSPALDAFCESVDYENDGLCEAFSHNAPGLSHSLQTVYRKGEIDFIYFSKLLHKKIGDHYPQASQKAFTVPGLHKHYGRWHDIFKEYGDYIRPAFGSEFLLNMVSRSESEIRVHVDHKRYDRIACTPLGGKESTLVQTEDKRLIGPGRNGTVITKRGCPHTSPSSDNLRVVIMAQPVERDSFTGMVLGFGV